MTDDPKSPGEGNHSDFSPPLWWLELTTPARNRFMARTAALTEFMQGWAARAAPDLVDHEGQFEIRGRARPFHRVEAIEIGDGLHDALLVSRLDPRDRACMQRLLADRYIKWCLHALISDSRQDVFPYNCFIVFKHPSVLTTEELARAKVTYERERA